MIVVKNVSKQFYSGRGSLNALQDVSFSAAKGATLALMGKSGSGKTTLLNCIGGLEHPDQGTITCFGVNLLDLSRKSLSCFQRYRVGFIFQYANLLSYLTVAENIAFPLFLNHVSGKEQEQRVRELLESIELPQVANAMPYELSGGEKQRVSFARAIAHNPDLLLADEPTASLDSETGRNLVSLMLDLSRKQGCTMIIATHDPDIVNLADGKLALRDGKVLNGMG